LFPPSFPPPQNSEPSTFHQPPSAVPGGQRLAPVIVQQIGRTIREIKNRGFTVLLVEQNFRFAAPLADRFYVIEHGQVIESFGAAELQAKQGMLHEVLGV